MGGEGGVTKSSFSQNSQKDMVLQKVLPQLKDETRSTLLLSRWSMEHHLKAYVPLSSYKSATDVTLTMARINRCYRARFCFCLSVFTWSELNWIFMNFCIYANQNALWVHRVCLSICPYVSFFSTIEPRGTDFLKGEVYYIKETL